MTPTPSTIPGFVPAYIRPLFCEGNGPFRWVALSGDPQDIAVTDDAMLEALPGQRALAPLDQVAGEKVQLPGPARRICWLGYGERAKAGCDLQRAGAHRQGQGADRHRPRSPRLRLGRLPLPRDRGHERRQRRHRRLADPQRAAQHRRRARAG